MIIGPRLPAFGYRYSPLLTFADPGSRLAQLLLYDYESLADFVQDRIKVRLQDHLFRVYHYICISSGQAPSQSHGLAETSLHAIPLDGSAQGSADRESNAKACCTSARGCRLPIQIEHSHRSRKMTAPLLINALEIGMA